MKKLVNKYYTNIFIVMGLSLCISLFNISRVIFGALHIPKDSTYLAVGHYSMDYFEYVQQIAQGMFGHAFVENQFTVFDTTKTLIGWGQYLCIGKIAGLFHLSPFFAYWASVFVLSFVLCLILFYIIRIVLFTVPFTYQILAFIFSVFALPFAESISLNGPNYITLYDFWYAPITLFHRIGGVPHHIATSISVGLSIIVFGKLISKIQTIRMFYLYGIILAVLLLPLLTFAPLQVVILMTSFLCISFIWFIRQYKKYKWSKIIWRYIWMFGTLTVVVGLFGLYLKFAHGTSELFIRAMKWESAQSQQENIFLIIKTLGPMILLVPFGIVHFITSASITRITLLSFVLCSYLFYSSPIASILGTFNQRFLTPYVYILISCIAVESMYFYAKHSNFKKICTYCFIGIFLLYFFIGTIFTVVSYGKLDRESYLSNGVVLGIKQLPIHDTKAVLTSPSSWLGMIVPIYVDKKVYLGRTMFTPDYETKQILSDSFYQKNMTNKEAEMFLQNNLIGYVILTKDEPYSSDTIRQYPFLTEFYANDDIRIFSYEH